MTRIFHWFFYVKDGSHVRLLTSVRLVFTLPPRDSTVQFKRCIQLWNNFPCITTFIITLCQSVCVYLSMHLFICLSIYLSSWFLVLNQTWIYLAVYFLYISIYLSILLSIYLSGCYTCTVPCFLRLHDQAVSLIEHSVIYTVS